MIPLDMIMPYVFQWIFVPPQLTYEATEREQTDELNEFYYNVGLFSLARILTNEGIAPDRIPHIIDLIPNEQLIQRGTERLMDHGVFLWNNIQEIVPNNNNLGIPLSRAQSLNAALFITSYTAGVMKNFPTYFSRFQQGFTFPFPPHNIGLDLHRHPGLAGIEGGDSTLTLQCIISRVIRWTREVDENFTYDFFKEIKRLFQQCIRQANMGHQPDNADQLKRLWNEMFTERLQN